MCKKGTTTMRVAASGAVLFALAMPMLAHAQEANETFVSPARVAEDQTSSKSPADVRVVREDMMNIMGSYERIFKRYKLDDELLASLIEAEQVMKSISDEDFAVMAEAIAPQVAKASRLVDQLGQILLADRAARRTKSSLGWPGGLEGPPIDYPDLGDGEFTFGWADDPDPTEGTCTGGQTPGAVCHANSDCPNCDPDDNCQDDIGRCTGQDEDPTNTTELALCSGSLRADADARYTILGGFIMMEGVRDIAGRFCDQQFWGFSCNLCCIPVDILYQVAHFFYESFELCDDLIDSAEIEGSFDRLGHFHDDWTCKFPDQYMTPTLAGHGCNGIDDNCSGVIDECNEDTFGPVVFIDPAVRLTCYKDAAAAADAVAQAVLAFDDCGGVTISDPVVNGTDCDVTVDVTATDDCGNSTTASTVVTIDGDGADVTIDPTVAGVCYASIDAAEQAVLAAATINDNCNSAGDLNITVHSSVTECALRVRLDVTDKCGNTSTAAVTVRVDPHSPTVDIRRLRLGFRGEVLAFQTPVCYETASEAEAAVLAVTHAEDDCTVGKELVTTASSQGDPCSLQVTSTTVDECLNQNTDTVTVRVDATSPVVTCAVVTDTLWSPNHTMVNVGFTYTATDNCSGEPKIEIFVTSDEPTASASGAGQISPAPDAFVLRDLDGVFQGVLIRAERSSRGNGRVYEITARATDECGNVGQCSTNVGVPPKALTPAVDDGQFYDATQVN